MSERKGYTLADIQRMREEFEISSRLEQVAHEHRMQQLLGDDVYGFMRGDKTQGEP
ncbi:hypothetical protein ACIBQ0_17100 [Nocardia nova]|uniref:hypothetical protein n=1 Tax=Nocardia nova TaxID=37330 RepID=UPI00378A340C